jgi:hypothetical protein
MQRTVTLEDVVFEKSWVVKFNDKSFGPPSLEDLETYSEEALNEISGILLRSLLFIEYMKNSNVNISATLNTDDPQGNWVKFNG